MNEAGPRRSVDPNLRSPAALEPDFQPNIAASALFSLRKYAISTEKRSQNAGLCLDGGRRPSTRNADTFTPPALALLLLTAPVLFVVKLISLKSHSHHLVGKRSATASGSQTLGIRNPNSAACQ